MAECWGLPLLLVRLMWVIAFLPGIVPGLLFYVACWLLIPLEPHQR